MNTILRDAKKDFEKISLTDNYRSKKFTKNFDRHLMTLVDTTITLAGEHRTILSNDNISITDKLYWEAEGYVLEKLDTVIDKQILHEFNNLEDILYDRIKDSLGNDYNNSEALNLMIDNSVHDCLLAVKFHFFDRKDEFSNPWQDARNILFDNHILHTFSNDIEKLNAIGFKIESSDSADIVDKKINIVGKGKRSDYSYGFVRDLIGLRNTVIQILDEDNSFGSSATKADQIILKLRRMGVLDTELSDNNIKYWLITPLKRSNRIGSDKEGYFLLKDCNDIKISYNSHFENFKGYYRTLENHRKLALKFGCSDDNFIQHLSFFNNLDINAD